MPRKTAKKKDSPKGGVSGSKKKKHSRKSPATVKWVAFFVFLAVVVALANYDLFVKGDGSLIKQGVTIGPVNAAGKTAESAKNDIGKFLSGYRLTYITSHGTESLGPFNQKSQDIVNFHVNTATETAYRIGRHDSKIVSLAQRAGAAMLGAKVPIPFSLDDERLLDELRKRFGALVQPAKNAELRIVVDSSGEYTIQVTPEQIGTDFETENLLKKTRKRLRNLSSESIDVKINTDQPELTAEELRPLTGRVGRILEEAPQEVSIKELAWTISRSQLADWIVPIPDGHGGWKVALDNNRMSKHLETYASSVAVEPKNAIFEMDEETGKVAEFSPGVNGEAIDVKESIQILRNTFMSENADKEDEIIELPLAVQKPEITTAESNEYGIKDLLAVGESNFRGSPAKRRHNIATGAESLHGILIPPEEEFSLVKALGDIDAENGYLQELVIKENETKPEYGGGLCQIGTTTFRTVMNAGLPITERRNHSYRVSYYERDGDGNYIGPGKDATIYDPWPDFKFMNDTPAHILIQTEIDGNKLSFYFWGTDDGRTAEQGEVSVWNVEDPPPKKEVFTTDLEPGTWRCTEHPHPSASTVFTYTVTYPDGEVKEEDIYSYYKPWREVCLVGVTEEELAQKEAEKEAAEASEGNGMTEVPPNDSESQDTPAEG